MTNREYLEKYVSSDKLDEAYKRLEQGEPVQYIVGNVDFYGNKFNIDDNVLIPRFETELLVNKCSMYVKKYFSDRVNILDIGTGSGVIAVTMKKLVDCDVTGVDISESALVVAKENAKNNGEEITFLQSDLFENVNDKFDVIISNPPYIAYDEEIDEVVKNNEPAIALYAGNDGLEFYERIICNSRKYVNEKFFMGFEIGMTQGERVCDIVKEYYPDALVWIEKDLPGKDRFVFVIREV